MPRPPRTTAKAAPHSKAKAAARDLASLDPDMEWASSISERLLEDCHPHQRDAVLDESKRISLLVGRGGGKGLPLTEPVMTPSGEVPIAKLRVGSRVLAPDGTVSHVIGVFPQGRREVFEIEFDDGAVARCDDQHIWPIHVQGRDRDTCRGRDMTALEGPGYQLMLMPEVIRRWEAGHRLHIPTMSAPAAMPHRGQKKWQVIDPYVLGLLLGDGSLRSGDVRFFTDDAELADAIVEAGLEEKRPDARNGLRIFRAPVGSDVYRALVSLGLIGKHAWDKAIPAPYRVSSPERRLAILQGLMDTDGYIDHRGNTTFCSTSKTLAAEVQWIVRSLGGKATLWRKKTARRDAFTVYIQPGGKFVPFRLRRKAERARPYQHARLWRRVVAIRPLGKQRTVCIQVDHWSGLFVTRDFVVTHNTTVLRTRAVLKMISTPNARIAYVATSRPEAERLNWEPLKQLIEALGESDNFEFHESRMRCTCKKTGATYSFLGADDKREINKLRGQPFDEFQVDETASHDPSLLELMLDRAIGPRLGERKGVIVLAGTPGHILRGRFYDVTRPGCELHRSFRERDLPEFADWIGWSSHHWSMVEVLAEPGAAERYPALALNWAAALEEKKRQGWTDDNPVWQREYLGRWAADSTLMMYQYRAHDAAGRPFNQWDPLGGRKLEGVAAIKAAVAALPDDVDAWLFGYGQDLGARDPYALNIFAFSPSDPKRRLYHVFSFSRRAMYARLIAELLVGEDTVQQALRGEAYTEVGGLFGVTGWPPAIVADLAGLGETLVDELSNVYGIKISAAHKKDKFGAIEAFNGCLVDGRMFILAGSELEQQLTSLQWKPDEAGQNREDKSARNDQADAATYICTEITGLFGAPSNKPKREGEKRTASGKRDDRPREERRAGEFDALLKDDFGGLNW